MPHPYDDLAGTPLWNVLEQAIEDLVLNRDIAESTPRPYIVGYLCRKIVTFERCLRLRSIYDLTLLPGSYPTSEVSAQRFPEPESGAILMYLAEISGIASHGTQLLDLKTQKRRNFRALVDHSFADRWPDVWRKITVEHTPCLHKLMINSEEARLLIKDALTA